MQKTIKNIISSYKNTVGKKQFYFILVFGFFVALISVVEPLIFTQIIKQIELYYQTGDFNSTETTYLIIYWGIFILFTIAIQYFFDYHLLGKSVNMNYIETCNKYSKKIISMNYSDYLIKKQGTLYKIFDRGTDNQMKFLFFFFGEGFKSLSGILIIITILFYIDFVMALLVLSMLPIMIFLGIFFMKKVSPHQRKLNIKWDGIFGTVGNILSGFILTKTLTLESNYIKDIINRLNSIYNKQMQVNKMWSISTIYTGMVVMVSRILVLGFGVYFVINGSLSFASLFLFFSYIGWIYFPLGGIFARLRDINEQITSVDMLYKELDNLDLENIDRGKTLRNISGNIDYKNIYFGYHAGKNTLKNLSFTIKSGEKVAFVGNTGAGKSTIVSLLLRFWEINSGEILIDGKNIKELSKKSLRHNIGIVTQENSLFNDTIKNNLLFAKPKATKKEIELALKKSEATFVYELENGLDTIIGERGLKLSGGEKQRLAIARLFLKNPKILVLDEATSALDNKTEKLIQKALDNLTKGRTSIVVAHRLSTIQNADKIFMLENGEIIESGNYDGLMNKKAKFFNLANPKHLMIN